MVRSGVAPAARVMVGGMTSTPNGPVDNSVQRTFPSRSASKIRATSDRFVTAAGFVSAASASAPLAAARRPAIVQADPIAVPFGNAARLDGAAYTTAVCTPTPAPSPALVKPDRK